MRQSWETMTSVSVGHIILAVQVFFSLDPTHFSFNNVYVTPLLNSLLLRQFLGLSALWEALLHKRI